MMMKKTEPATLLNDVATTATVSVSTPATTTTLPTPFPLLQPPSLAMKNSSSNNNNNSNKHSNSYNNHKNHVRSAMSGALAGVFAKTAVAPIERVKLLKQLQGRFYEGMSAVQVASSIYHTEGVLAFWRGNLPNVMQQAGSSALNFMFMGYYKALAGDSYMSSFWSGGMAGGTATTILYPVQFLRTRLAADRQASTMQQLVVNAVKVDGMAGLYQGYGIALAGIFLYRGLHLGGYDAVKKRLPNLTWPERLAVAQVVSLTAGTLCYPIDSVRRRLMMQAGCQEKLYRNASHAFVTIWKQEGVRGFFRGLGPNLVRSLGAALLLVSYDALQSI